MMNAFESSQTPSVFVDYEYGTLSEVIVGAPYGMTPSLKAPWFENALKVLPEEEAAYSRETAGMLWDNMIHPDSGKSETELLEEENQAFIAVLEQLGVKVRRPSKLTPQIIADNYGEAVLINGFSQDFPRDNLVVIGNKVIELTLGTPLRKVDILGFREILSAVCDDSVQHFSMPQVPLLSEKSDDTLALEGGDVLVLGDTVLVGNSGNPSVGSNEAGYRWLAGMLGDDYKTIRVPLIETVLHLDCALSVPRDGLAIICPDAFIEGIPAKLDGWDLIEVSLEDVARLAVNGVPIDQENYILSYNDANDNSFIEYELNKRGIKTYRVFFGTHNGQGGSLRCATQPIMRKLP